MPFKQTVKSDNKALQSAALKLLLAFSITLGIICTAHANSDAERRAAIAAAMQQAGGQGKVLSAKPGTDRSGNPIYQVRILANGRVKTITVPAKATR